MLSDAATRYSTNGVFVGIDVGGPAKGYHFVSLVDGQLRDIHKFARTEEVLERCISLEAQVVAIDAPCKWSTTGRARKAERELMKEKIWCFSTPSREAAERHPTDHYAWMRAGIQLYAALERSHPLIGATTSRAFTVETFPQAVACALAGKIVSAKKKSTVRRALLRELGLNDGPLRNIDYVDAALCAVAARASLSRHRTYGDVESGLILVPA